MTALRKLRDWLRYERLAHYPALAAFDRESALQRLRAYEREERAASQPWLTTLNVLIIAFLATCAVLAAFNPLFNAFMLVTYIPGWLLQYELHCRIRRRVEAKVAAELSDGRLWKCVECDYDLRSSEERCPECGAPVRVAPPAPANSYGRSRCCLD